MSRLALLAMALIMVMPVISRSIMPAHGMAAMPGMGDGTRPPAAHGKAPVSPGLPHHPLVCCGYCVLLGHPPTLTFNVVPVLVLPPPFPFLNAAVFSAPHLRPVFAANPRAPPLPA
ncbi:MAG: DUF2946 domain-containing protein [Xanthomonadaceae bacterium]|nr:DUF2946 domain-containing protein [Xanthomonadaceae bacterium]